MDPNFHFQGSAHTAYLPVHLFIFERKSNFCILHHLQCKIATKIRLIMFIIGRLQHELKLVCLCGFVTDTIDDYLAMSAIINAAKWISKTDFRC